MVSHAEFLRSFWEGKDEDFAAFVRQTRNATIGMDQLAPPDAVERVNVAIETLVGFDPAELAMLKYVARLTLHGKAMRGHHAQDLRHAGFDDRGIVDIVGVASCFAYMNRLADGTGVTLNELRWPLAEELYGRAALDRHLAWGRGEAVAMDDADG